MSVVVIVWLFLLWTIFWSFWSVILTRMEKKIKWKTIKGFLIGRSHCPSCWHQLTWRDLIPLYSWFSTRGKCKYCGKKLSSIYPTLEIVSGLVFVLRWCLYVLPYWVWQGTLPLLLLGAWWLLGLLLVWDLYTYYLHVPVWFALVVVVITQTIVDLVLYQATRNYLWIPLLFFIFFLLIYWFGWWYTNMRFWKAQEAFWQWDVMLAPIIWLLFAFAWFPNQWDYISLLLFYVMISCVFGLLHFFIASYLMKMRVTSWRLLQYQHKSPMIPFLPSMIIAYWVFQISILFA